MFGGVFLVGCVHVSQEGSDHEMHEMECGCEDVCGCDEHVEKSDRACGKGDSKACAAEAVAIEADFYQPYSAEKLSTVRGEQPVALFFHADWCSTCVKLENKILAADFPEGALVLVVNYDEDVALKKEFGVTKQSTVVLLDADGEMFEVVMNPPVEEIISHFQ